LRFKIGNKLKKRDYTRITDFLGENPNASIELFPGEEFDFVAISPLVVAIEGFGYSIISEISFQQPIGLKVFKRLKLNNGKSRIFSVNFRNIKLSKIVIEKSELMNDLNESLTLLERIVNQTCNMLDKLVEKTFVINTKGLDEQLDQILRARELKKRGEVAKPFDTIHAKSRNDARERSDNLIPIYLEKDKSYLYEDNRVFILLPRDFVMKLLRMEKSTLVPSNQFTNEEKKVLKQLSMREYLKTTKVSGKNFYYDLNNKTKKLLLKGLKKI
jgi:hypothetical protein